MLMQSDQNVILEPDNVAAAARLGKKWEYFTVARDKAIDALSTAVAYQIVTEFVNKRFTPDASFGDWSSDKKLKYILDQTFMMDINRRMQTLNLGARDLATKVKEQLVVLVPNENFGFIAVHHTAEPEAQSLKFTHYRP